MKWSKDRTIIYSPTDLIRYLQSPFATWMDRYHLEYPTELKPDEADGQQVLIAEAGNEHERAFLEVLREEIPGLLSVEREGKSFAECALETRSAVLGKAPAVFQAALEAGQFAGYADFLVLDQAGNYEVWDTKLGRSPKPYYLIQLCCYAEMLAAITGVLSEMLGVVLASTQERLRATGQRTDRRKFRLQDFWYYYQQLKASFLAMMDGFVPDFATRPDPACRADHGRWQSHAEQWLYESDHLGSVAGMAVGQIKKLNAAGVSTIAGLAAYSGLAVPKMTGETLRKLVRQARLQVATRDARLSDESAHAAFELIDLPLSERKGLSVLPPADAGDVYFDMEGYPLAEGGLEYLFGACYHEGQELLFVDWWAHDRPGEKKAFEGFIDWIVDRRKRFPGLHIFHYAAYEVSAVRRLSSAHATREDEVDDLLRAGVFVDLYQLFRQGIVLGEDSYSIKKVELLYRGKRATGVANAGDSIVEYANWLSSGQSSVPLESEILKNIRDYNEDDCRSTADLVVWLRGTQRQFNRPWIPRAAGTGDDVEEEASVEKSDGLRDGLLAAAYDASGLLIGPDYATLAHLLEFHRRELKPMWWRFFERIEMTPDELSEDGSCLSMVERTGAPVPEKKSLIQQYSFDSAEDTKLGSARFVMFSHCPNAKFSISGFNEREGTFQLKLSSQKLKSAFGNEFPASGSLIPDEFVSQDPIPAAVRRAAERYLSGSHPLLRKLLFREPPISSGGALVRPGEAEVDAAVRVASEMDQGVLCIQGPPGTGKTFTAAHVIASLIRAGKRVGITSNSHKAVINVIRKTAEVFKDTRLRGVKVGGDREDPIFDDFPNLEFASSNDAADLYRDVGGVICGTAWLFSRPEWDDAIDYLFVDEAGQVSLANLVAMSLCARNVILLGDQMQLEQPIQGSHPGESGLSALQYYLQDHATIPPDLGIFLGRSFRMHPDICRFVSEVAYEGRLQSVEGTSRQNIEIEGGSGLVHGGSGIVFVPVEHDGNTQASDEEVEVIESLYNELVGKEFTDSRGLKRPLSLDDFLFIAPYNLQVAKLRSVLPPNAKIGSVDRFQGQEAPVTILSMCSSFGEYGSRGLVFLLDRNRLNVAISRAKCLCVVVGDPRTAHAEAANLGEMELLNLYCRLVSEGSVVPAHPNA